MECFPIIVSSPSGGGKTTIVAELLKADGVLSRIVTATTRAPRTGEVNGKDYHFWTQEEFEAAIKNNKMAEWAKVHVNYYGIPKSSLDTLMAQGVCPVLVIDVQGAKTVKNIYKDAVTIFIVPPSIEELKKRISARNDGTQNIEVRLKTAEEELKQIEFYDYLVINDKLEDAVNNCRCIITAEKCKVKRQGKFTGNLK